MSESLNSVQNEPSTESEDSHSLTPHEYANETLNTLSQYTVVLEKGSYSAAHSDIENKAVFYQELAHLFEGLTTFIDGITSVKQAFKSETITSVNVLEAKLLSVLRDLLQAQEKNHLDFMIELLQFHLPLNLKQWREEGIPTLLRCRDC